MEARPGAISTMELTLRSRVFHLLTARPARPLVVAGQLQERRTEATPGLNSQVEPKPCFRELLLGMQKMERPLASPPKSLELPMAAPHGSFKPLPDQTTIISELSPSPNHS